MIPDCNYCMNRLAEIHSALVEANAIQQDLRGRLVARLELNQNAIEWYRLAADRWHDASAELCAHLVTHKIRPRVAAAAEN